MKTKKYKTIRLLGFGFVLLFLISGCEKGFEEMNKSPNEPEDVPTTYLLTDAQKGLMSFLWDEWWNGRFGMLYSQYWSQASYTDESRYKPREGVNNNYWIYFYAGRDAHPPDGELNGGGMMSLERIIEINTNPETAQLASRYGSNNNQIAVARILKAWMFQILTDIWGYIPYDQALEVQTYLSPAYDSQQYIYEQLLIELTEAVAQMDDGKGPAGDLIYNGNMAQWKKFANSLKLRIAMRMSDVAPDMATTAINEAVASGIFESNDDNAWLIFEVGKPNNNPLYQNQTERSDFAVSKVLVDFLEARSDPRLDFYANAPIGSDEHVGFPYGMSNSEATPISTDNVSMPGNVVYAPQAPGFFMNYDEVCFIMAEASLELGVAGSAQEWYEMGIEASMEMWNMILGMTPTGWYRIDNHTTDVLPEAITADDMSAYMADPMVDWNGGEDQMKLIAEQKYIALYPQGLQAWFEWRRTTYPDVLVKAGDVISYSIGTASGEYTFDPLVDPGDRGIPTRMTYPKEEITLNQGSYDAAVSAMGGDNFDVKTWWDPN